MFQVKNHEGRPFNVKIVRKGDRYGRDNCLVHGLVEPLVEFYDAAADPATFGPDGQFVTRYYVGTLLTDLSPGRGLDLLTYVDVWKIDAAAMSLVLDWIRAEIKPIHG